MIAIAGSVGALLRYTIGAIIPSIFILDFPVSTLVINLVGTFMLSWFFSYTETSENFPLSLKAAISTGLIGSFTTFSTFNVELLQLLQTHAYFATGIYLLASIAGGYACVRLGRRLAQ